MRARAISLKSSITANQSVKAHKSVTLLFPLIQLFRERKENHPTLTAAENEASSSSISNTDTDVPRVTCGFIHQLQDADTAVLSEQLLLCMSHYPAVTE